MATQTASLPAPMQLLRMSEGLILHQALYAAAKLGIADLLRDGERSAADLAAASKVNEDALYRTLRYLSSQSVFHELPGQTFRNSELSHHLRSDVPGSLRAMFIFRGSGYFFPAFAEFLYSVESGLSAREKTLGMDGFEYLRLHPEEARIFDEAMTSLSALSAPAIAGAYDFGAWGSLMDVGGGNGVLLAAILKAHGGLRGVLADQEHVLERARQEGFLSGEVQARAAYQPCDFFQSVPGGCRAYLMKNIIHDWDDERAGRILRNCRQAVPPDGALLLVEHRVGEANAPALGKATDLVMLVMTGGKERTVEQLGALLSACGFRLNRTAPAGPAMIVEALPA